MKLSTMKVRRHGQANRWLAGFWEEHNTSPSGGDGSVGFYGSTPEEAVQKMLGYIEEQNDLPTD